MHPFWTGKIQIQTLDSLHTTHVLLKKLFEPGLVSLHIAYDPYSLFVFLAFWPMQQIPFITRPLDVSGVFSVFYRLEESDRF